TEADPFAQQVLRRVRPLSVSRVPRQQRSSIAVSTTRPLIQAAPPRVRSDAPSAALPLAAPARPVAAGEEEGPAAQRPADTQFFEGSTGDAQWDALWAMRGTRRSAPEEPAPPEGGPPAPRRPASRSRPSAPPVQLAPSSGEPSIVRRPPEQRPPEPVSASPERGEIAPGVAEPDVTGYPEREASGAEVTPPTAPDTSAPQEVAAPRSPGPTRSPAPVQRETERPTSGKASPPPVPRATPAHTIQRSQTPAAQPVEEPLRSQHPAAGTEPQADDTTDRAADVRPTDMRPADVRPADVHRLGTSAVPRREQIVPRSRLEELPTQGPHAQSEQPVQHGPPVQEAPAPEDVSQPEMRSPYQVPAAPPSQGQPPPPASVQRAPEGTVEAPAEERRISQPPVEPDAEPGPATPRPETGRSTEPPSASTGPVRHETEPGTEPKVSARHAPEAAARDGAVPGPAAAKQDTVRPTYSQAPPERAPASSPPVQRAAIEREVERARPAPSSTDRASLSGEAGERAFDERAFDERALEEPAPEERVPDQQLHGEPPGDERALPERAPDQGARPELPAAKGSRFAPPHTVQETVQPPAGAPLARQAPAEDSSPSSDAAPVPASDRSEPAPLRDAAPRPGQVQPARESRVPAGEAAQPSTEGTAHTQVDAATAAREAVTAVAGEIAGGDAVDRRALLRQALQPRIVPTVVQAAPEGGASTSSAEGTQQASTAAGPAGEAAPDIESLARDVYRILRRRLLVEQERELGRR
ncbi:MAG: hypothetical protein ACK2VD_07750, partial [Anaerolineae bacterium]